MTSPVNNADSGYVSAEEFERGELQERRPSVPGVTDLLVRSTSEFGIHREIMIGGRQSDPLAHNRLPHRIFPPSTLGSLKGASTGKQIGDQLPAVASLELIWNGLQKPKDEYQQENTEDVAPITCRRLSAEEIMRVAGTRFIQLKDHSDDFSSLTHPFGSGLSVEVMKEVELAQILLSAAEKVGEQQFDHASWLLSFCEKMSLKRESPVQRIVLSFTKALLERINKATGKYDPKGEESRTDHCLMTNLTLLNCHKVLPFTQITQFTGIQVIVEKTTTASRIHLINLAIRSGIQMIVLMKALLERKANAVELLKVTAIPIVDRETVEESGRRLVNVAKTMGLNFLFKVIPLQDIDDVREDMFDVEDGEAVAVYAPMVLETMISRQNSLERLTMVMKSLNPSVMVITEVQANHNSPSFMTRFTEALFFYSTFIDSLETCLADDRGNDTVSEQYLFNGVKNMLSSEGHERTSRNVKIDVWRAFFARYGMIEIGLSEASLYQARLVAEQFPCARSCTLEHDGKCLLVGWRGTPMLSLSAWKFR